MLLADNETKLDLLNNEAIATTIVGLISENPERAVTVGVHGDWGAGKSSVLEMIEVHWTAQTTSYVSSSTLGGSRGSRMPRSR